MNKITRVSINNPMCGVDYKFNYPREEFLERFSNQVAGVGFFTGETVEGNTLIITPNNCSFIEIFEELA